MRIIPIIAGVFWFLTNFSTIGATTSLDPDDKSDLLLIAEDFRILSRITNAISLHVAAVENKIELNDVLSELFRIDKTRFLKIINVDVASATKEINRMLEVKEQELNQRKSNNDGNLHVLDHLLKFFRNLPYQVEVLKKASEVPTEKLLNAANSVQILDAKNCSLDFKNMKQVSLLFGEKSEINSLDDAEITNRLTIFRDQYTKVSSCLEELPKVEQNLKDLEIQKVYEEHRKVVRAKKTAMEFWSLSGNTKIFSVMKPLSQDLLSYHSVWNKSALPGEDMSSIMRNLNNSVSTTHSFIHDFNNIDVIVTAGFSQPEDMKKVFEDLKSPWFQQKVARGANTEKLSNELFLYGKISKQILYLISQWKSWVVSSAGLINKDVLDLTSSLKNLKDFKQISKKTISNLNQFVERFEGCYNRGKLDTLNTDFRNLSANQLPFEIVAKQLRKVENLVSSLKRESVYTIDGFESYIKYVEVICTELNNRGKGRETPTAQVQRIEVKIESHGPDSSVFFDIFDKIATVAEELALLKKLSKDVPLDQPLVSLKEILETSEIYAVADCFRSEEQGLNATIVAAHAVQDVLRFNESEGIDNLLELMSNFNKFQNAMNNMTREVRGIQSSYRKTDKNDTLLLALKNSGELSRSLGQSIKVLEDLDMVRQIRQVFEKKNEFSEDVRRVVSDNGLDRWIRPQEAINKLLDDTDGLNELAKSIRSSNLNVSEMSQIFENASKIEGIHGAREKLNRVYQILKKLYVEEDEKKIFEAARSLDLDFVKRSARLASIQVTVTSLQDYFDEIFGHKKSKIVTVETGLPWWLILCICVGLVLLMIVVFLLIFALTEYGRAWYKNMYLYYFGTSEDFEKRWRYSCFMDTNDGKNSLLDAVREGNRTTLLKALKRGAYIDVYNKFGNTALHVAAKFALPDHVELLIRYGADRSFLNYKNQTPLQYIPFDYKNTHPEKAEKYDKIKKIYKKYAKKGFRSSVPYAFPVTSFHIWMDDDVEPKLCNKFMDQFRSITNDEAMPTTTHCVVHVDAEGILETDRMDLLLWIFHGCIIVKEKWMTDCLENEKLIEKDYDYLVEKVRYNGVVYNTVLAWSEAMAKGNMPFLLGAYVAVVAKEYKNLTSLAAIVNTQGGVMMNTFPLKQHFNRDSHPYLHANLGPLFLIHDGSADLSVFKNDPDKMYTLFTEEEFMAFMLKRETNRDTREHPVPVVVGDE